MNKKLFADLVESMTQMNEIARGERAPSRKFHVDALSVEALCSKPGLSQPKVGASLPARPRALLTAINRDPKDVAKALRKRKHSWPR